MHRYADISIYILKIKHLLIAFVVFALLIYIIPLHTLWSAKHFLLPYVFVCVCVCVRTVCGWQQK